MSKKVYTVVWVYTVSWVIKLNKPNNLYCSCQLLYAFGFMLFALSYTLLCYSPVMAEGLSLSGNINYISTEQKEDGETILKESDYFRNLYFTFEKPITPLISYQLNFRTNWSDFRLTDAEDRLTKNYQRAIEPAFDLFLRNPIYDFSAGYRRLEQWTTAHLQNEGRRTTDFLYSRLNITPIELPSLSLEVNRQNEFDYLSPKKIDTTDTRFIGNSWYRYLYKGLDLSYHFTYTHDEIETPANKIEKTKDYNFNGLYNIAYFRSFWSGKTDISASYQGNYIRDKNEIFASQKGNVLFERVPYVNGLYLHDTTPNMDALGQQPLLINKNYKTDVTGIKLDNINGQTYQNIGIWIASFKPVDTLYIYYKNDGLADSITWRIYWSNNNLNWNFITEVPVSPTYDSIHNAFRYVITFPATSASYFKAVNLNTVPQVGSSDVEVTEIEAYGKDVISETGKRTDVNNFFNQGINVITNIRPLPRLNFSLNYFLNRSDQHPVSFWNSLGGVFSNIVSNSISGDDRLRSNILRTYGATSTWFTHRLLTTTLSLQRNEAFDNRNETDFSANTYSLSFASAPLPTLNTNLSFIMNDNYNFGNKETSNDSVLLSIISKLYRDVNMVTDITYTRSKSYITDIRSDTTSINGSIDAHLSQKLYGSLIYRFSRTSSDNNSFNTSEGQTIITYQPGRFINITGTFRISDTDDNTTTSEAILVDWLPLPAIRLNFNYQHTNSDLEPTISDLLSTYLIWYITKFLDLQVTYSYVREEKETVTKNYSIGANLNCRFR